MSQAITPSLNKAFDNLPNDVEAGIFLIVHTLEKVQMSIATRTLHEGVMKPHNATVERSAKFHKIASSPSLDLAGFEKLHAARRCPLALKIMTAVKDLFSPLPLSLEYDLVCITRFGAQERSLRYEWAADKGEPSFYVGDAIPDDLDDLTPLAKSPEALAKILAEVVEIAESQPRTKTPLPPIDEDSAEIADA